MKVMRVFFVFILLMCCFQSNLLFAQGDDSPLSDTLTNQTDTFDIYEMSIEQLMQLRAVGLPSELEKIVNSLIAAASKKPLSVRESPSIITLITAEEIQKSGARDLIDVLRLVPGMDFGIDVFGVIGMGVRGNWAHEGKVLVLLDGQEMNEILYGTNQFGNHYPVDMISKIEIIRGPGSAIYGGYAEYGVINIITKSAEELNGVSVSGIYGQTATEFARRNGYVSVGKQKDDFAFTLSAFAGQGNRSDQIFTDIYGDTKTMSNGNSLSNPLNLNLGVKLKGLSVRVIADQYHNTSIDGYDKVTDYTYKQNFNSYFGEIKYIYKVNDKFSITPRINFKQQQPWATPTTTDISEDFNKLTRRYTGNLSASWNINRKINFVFGAESFLDQATDNVDDSYFSNGEKKISYLNIAGFAQGLIKHRLANLVLGMRYDNNSAFGSAFVPRVGLTKKYEKYHAKLLYSNAFRAPSIENINRQVPEGIQPELTQVIELEFGYQLTRNSILTFNLYDINTNNAIVYYYDVITEQDFYRNFGKTGSRGIEAEYRLKATWGHLNINYAFYSTLGKKLTDSLYMVESNPHVHLAFASHRLNLNSSININDNLSVNPTVSFFGKRYGYSSVDDEDEPVLEEFAPVYLLNLFVYHKNFIVKGLNVGIGVYDLFNQRFQFIQPYNGYHSPIAGLSREFIIKLSYDLNFAKK
jgi:outer membrane cobalamin receptor